MTVEYLLDDGSGLVAAVRWGAGPPAAALGDLVEVEGKLGASESELRVVRMSRLQDPNEEPLHWARAAELARERQRAAQGRAARQRQSPRGGHEREADARLAFFELRAADGGGERARAVRSVLELLLEQQRADADAGGGGGVRTSFAEVVRHLEAAHSQQQVGPAR